MTDGGTKTGDEFTGGKGAAGFCTAATGGAGIGFAGGGMSIMCLPSRFEDPAESGMHTEFGRDSGGIRGWRRIHERQSSE